MTGVRLTRAPTQPGDRPLRTRTRREAVASATRPGFRPRRHPNGPHWVRQGAPQRVRGARPSPRHSHTDKGAGHSLARVCDHSWVFVCLISYFLKAARMVALLPRSPVSVAHGLKDWASQSAQNRGKHCSGSRRKGLWVPLLSALLLGGKNQNKTNPLATLERLIFKKINTKGNVPVKITRA